MEAETRDETRREGFVEDGIENAHNSPCSRAGVPDFVSPRPAFPSLDPRQYPYFTTQFQFGLFHARPFDITYVAGTTTVSKRFRRICLRSC